GRPHRQHDAIRRRLPSHRRGQREPLDRGPGRRVAGRAVPPAPRGARLPPRHGRAGRGVRRARAPAHPDDGGVHGAHRRRARRSRRTPAAGDDIVTAQLSRILAGTCYVATLVVLAAVAAWPIYRTPALLTLIGVSAVLAGGVAVLAHRLRWG